MRKGYCTIYGAVIHFFGKQLVNRFLEHKKESENFIKMNIENCCL